VRRRIRDRREGLDSPGEREGQRIGSGGRVTVICQPFSVDLSSAVRSGAIKLLRARGGCLGGSGRRRAWQAAKSSGEPQAGSDPEAPEWGNPPDVMIGNPGPN
jgi:hypothetical protein